MKCIIHVLIEHPDMPIPMRKRLTFEAPTYEGILDQVKANNTPEYHVNNLRHYRRTKFNDVHGATHTWELTEEK